MRYLIFFSKNVFTLFAILVNTYLIICDGKVLSTLLSLNSQSETLPHTLIFISFTTVMRNVIFDDFIQYLIIVLYSVTLFLIFNLTFSDINLYCKLCECIIVIIFLLYQLIESHINCLRSKIIFWRKFSEEQVESNDVDIEKNLSSQFETETEHLIFICEKIKNDIKQASKAIIYKDIKLRLKESISDVMRIKKLIGHGNIGAPVIIENHVKDEEDREFIEQNYREISHSSNGEYKKSTTFINLFDHKSSTLFPDYGLQQLSSVLEGIGKNWSFDIWFVQETTGSSIGIVGQYLFAKFNLKKRFKISEDVLDRYLNSLESHYRDNPYHNACHGADVMHNLMYFVSSTDIQKFLNPIETLACIISGLAHDIGHPGVTSRYLIQTRDPLAIQFNDISVLENMHCAIIYQLLNKAGHNILEKVEADDWTLCRKIIIEMILATDMAKHFEILGRFRARACTLCDLNLDKIDDKILVLATGLKCADIGHSAKYNYLHQKWSGMVMEEFFKQGDLEKSKKLPVSMYCDRITTNIPKSQAGFLKNICLPLYDAWAKYHSMEAITKTLEELRKNIEYWDLNYGNRRSTQPAVTDNVASLKHQESYGGSHA
ncbi:hypothetical protein SteCoe_34247 [Stentor coeruleus]|uniref:PDEase domain-containing protein n=1 Tax=Stentor coeruleus TaxID=5963 RepID=A0A1R2AUY5_9CILI|nr:hypothetical protein SteCoe_34247 [Stentor coeruleus]